MISAEELRNRLKLNSKEECFQDSELQWFDHLERMEENNWSSIHKTFKISGSFPREGSRKLWSEEIRNRQKEKEVR